MTRGQIRGALLALVLAAGVCAGLVAVGRQTFPAGDPRAPRLFRQTVPVLEGAGATFYAFQRVPVTQRLRESATERVNNRLEDLENDDIRFVVSPLGGLLLVGLALFAGGLVTSPQPGHVLGSGVRMALLYALATFGLSFLLPTGETVIEPGLFLRRSTFVTYHPSHTAAFLWPLLWGLTFGSLGALVAAHGRGWRRALVAPIEARSPGWANALRAAGAGLATGLALVLLAGVLTAAVGIAFHPTEAGEVLGSGKNVAGIADGIIVGLPHATGAGLLAAMGVSAHYEFGDQDQRREFATANIFGGEKQRRIQPPVGGGGFGGPERDPFQRYPLEVPPYALGGLAIAAIFPVVTGYRAARGARSGVLPAIRSALMAATVLTIFLWLLAYLVGGHAEFVNRIGRTEGSVFSGWAGPIVADAVILPPLWSIGGGLVGALIASMRNRPRL
jgi:hypothetical protein